MHRYEPRLTNRLAPIVRDGWQLKQYSIVFGDEPLDRARFEGGLALALAELPAPAVTPERAGVGFVILHQGRGADYVVVAWWDRENELPLRVFVRDESAWRAAHGSESVCVWDLDVIAAERTAYVETVLGGGDAGGVAAYLERGAMSDLATRDLLRHTIATLAYRGGKALRGAPAEFASFRVSPTSRTPAEIVAHLCDLFDWAVWMARGEQRWKDSALGEWSADVERFFAALGALDDYVASGAPLRARAEQLFQGPIADALTHVGQLTMLRRAAGSPVRAENYARAEIRRGVVGAEQPAPRVEFG